MSKTEQRSTANQFAQPNIKNASAITKPATVETEGCGIANEAKCLIVILSDRCALGVNREVLTDRSI